MKQSVKLSDPYLLQISCRNCRIISQQESFSTFEDLMKEVHLEVMTYRQKVVRKPPVPSVVYINDIWEVELTKESAWTKEELKILGVE